jgi:hypothetical protein
VVEGTRMIFLRDFWRAFFNHRKRGRHSNKPALGWRNSWRMAECQRYLRGGPVPGYLRGLVGWTTRNPKMGTWRAREAVLGVFQRDSERGG